MNIVFASQNKGKIHELQALMAEFNVTIIPQTELSVSDIPETGLTFVENALIKARHACQETGFAAIADDSGLVVPALHGAPGIYSARYAGEKASSAENIQKLLQDLSSIPEEDRQASFHCVLVYLRNVNDPTPFICHGVWEGRILSHPIGEHGFGYDPIFFATEQNQCAAELPLAIKNQVSHRGKALRALVNLMKISG